MDGTADTPRGLDVDAQRLLVCHGSGAGDLHSGAVRDHRLGQLGARQLPQLPDRIGEHRRNPDGLLELSSVARHVPVLGRIAACRRGPIVARSRRTSSWRSGHFPLRATRSRAATTRWQPRWRLTRHPTGLPVQFHMAVVYGAMMYYGAYESAQEVYVEGQNSYRRWWDASSVTSCQLWASGGSLA
jgi:hypothetical protein